MVALVVGTASSELCAVQCRGLAAVPGKLTAKPAGSAFIHLEGSVCSIYVVTQKPKLLL